jgi:hypothetical protein
VLGRQSLRWLRPYWRQGLPIGGITILALLGAAFVVVLGRLPLIGMSYAQLEARLAVATIAQRYRLFLCEGPPVEPSVTSTLTPNALRTGLERRA